MRQLTTNKDECLLLRHLYKTSLSFFGSDFVDRSKSHLEQKIGREINVDLNKVLAIANAPETPKPTKATKVGEKVDMEKLMYELRRKLNQ